MNNDNVCMATFLISSLLMPTKQSFSCLYQKHVIPLYTGCSWWTLKNRKNKGRRESENYLCIYTVGLILELPSTQGWSNATLGFGPFYRGTERHHFKRYGWKEGSYLVDQLWPAHHWADRIEVWVQWEILSGMVRSCSIMRRKGCCILPEKQQQRCL